MAHRSEQGNVLGFVLVGALLVALLLGGIFVVRRMASTQSKDTTEVTMNDSSNKDKEPNDTSDAPANTSDKTQSDKDKESLENALKNQSSTNGGSAGQNSTTPPVESTANLPKTGPEDTLVSIAGIALLAGAGVSYVRSRRLI